MERNGIKAKCPWFSASAVYIANALIVGTAYRLIQANMLTFALSDLSGGDPALIWHYMRMPFWASLIVTTGILAFGAAPNRIHPTVAYLRLLISAILFFIAYTAFLNSAGFFLRNALTEALMVSSFAFILSCLMIGLSHQSEKNRRGAGQHECDEIKK